MWLRTFGFTSFLISLYSLHANSSVAARTMRDSGGERYITVLGELEVLNALELRVFRKELLPGKYELVRLGWSPSRVVREGSLLEAFP
jgi:hypothetical protein